jgi:hypothetical protein
MNISDLIKASEGRYLSFLESFFNDKWRDTGLWSHDLLHHRRVWQNAKELLGVTNIITDQDLIDKLLIACYLHDIGMVEDPGEKHGTFSRKICEEFLAGIDKDPSDFGDLLQVIESHDNKSYQGLSLTDSLFIFLSAADDLDAFSYIGIYRYLDIYLARRIQPGKIVSLVLKNAASRFEHFERNFGNYPDLISIHRKRYYLLRDFFQNLDLELTTKI